MDKNIAISMDKNFILAKAFVPYERDVKNLIVEVRQGYDLYQLDSNNELKLLYTGKEVGTEKTIEAKKNNHITLYWIKQEYVIQVPFGFLYNDEEQRINKGLNGVISLSLPDKINIEAFLHNFPSLNWETVYEVNVTYQYLSEYFIDSEHKQNGISIAIRNMLMPYLKECYSPELNENKLKDKMQAAVQKYFDSKSGINYGLKVKSVMTSVVSKEVKQ